MKTLIIAEKKSVGEAIAAAIGVKNRHAGYMDGNHHIVSWCQGHLIGFCKPDDYDKRYHVWSMDDLPIIPVDWKTEILAKTEKQFRILKGLMNDSAVLEIICATDAGREGELIFRLVYDKAKCRKSVKRLWVNSIEEEAIRNGMESLKPASEYDGLYLAALCRAKADWLIGMNLSRLFSLKYENRLTIGRVQSPTVNLIVQRDKEIHGFSPQFYRLITADTGGLKLQMRVETEAEANAICEVCIGQNAVITSVESKNGQSRPPRLYNLTDIQRDANRIYGYSAQKTLDTIQSLYEKKLCTYPRTDSRYLPHEMHFQITRLIEQLMDTPSLLPDRFRKSFPMQFLETDRLICDEKITDHHALVPTASVVSEDLSELSEAQHNLLYLMVCRLILAAAPPQEFRTHTIKADIAGYAFETKLKEITKRGWKDLYSVLFGKPAEENEPEEVSSIPKQNDSYPVINLLNEPKQTAPPKPFTEDTLLAAMEHAGKSIEDTELRSAIRDCGLGTPATRAGTIESIIRTGYVKRQGKTLIPTEKGMQLIAILNDRITSPELTAHWEQMLSLIQIGSYPPEQFLDEIISYIKEVQQEVLK